MAKYFVVAFLALTVSSLSEAAFAQATATTSPQLQAPPSMSARTSQTVGANVATAQQCPSLLASILSIFGAHAAGTACACSSSACSKVPVLGTGF